MESTADRFFGRIVKIEGKEIPLAELTTIEQFEQSSKEIAPSLFDKKVIGGSTHYRSNQLGLEFEYEKGRLNSLFIYLHQKKVGSYAGKLPFGLSATSTMEATLYRLGQPSAKHGGKSTFVQLTYEWLGVEFSFQTTSWQQKEAKIIYFVLFQPDLTKLAHCAMCKKPASIACPTCPYVRYCSQGCVNSFSKHREHCP